MLLSYLFSIPLYIFALFVWYYSRTETSNYIERNPMSILDLILAMFMFLIPIINYIGGSVLAIMVCVFQINGNWKFVSPSWIPKWMFKEIK